MKKFLLFTVGLLCSAGMFADLICTVTLDYDGPDVEATEPIVAGAGTYFYGDDVEIYAQNYVEVKGLATLKKEYFVQWSDGNTDNPRTISGISGDLSLTAVYHQFVTKTILDTITVGETLSFNDAYIDDPAGRFVEAWGHGTDLTAFAKSSTMYGNSYTAAVSAKTLGFGDFSPLPDTLYKWQLKCFSGEPVIYYVAPGGTHSTAYALGKAATQSSWADPYGDLNLACKHAGAYHATNGQQNVVLVAAGTYDSDDGTYVVSFPACIAVYGGFAGGEELSGKGTLADQIAEIVAARDMETVDPAPYNFVNKTIIDGEDKRRAAVTATNNNKDCATLIDGLTFKNGNYETSKYAAGIDLRGNVILRNSIVTGNNSTGAAAGGVYAVGTTAAADGTMLVPQIDYCLIENNTATSATAAVSGGGVYVYSYGLKITNSLISNNTLNGNYSTAYGAGVYVKDGEVSIDGTTITGNEANGTSNALGGGLYLAKGTASVTSSIFRSNAAKGSTAKTHGAGAYIAVSGSSFEDVLFAENVLTPAAGPAYGAGLYAVNAALTDVTFGGDLESDGNIINGVSAAYGAGAYITLGPVLNDVIVKHNKIINGTTLYGGGLHLTGGATLNNPVIEYNVLTPTATATTATVHGAGAYLTGGATVTGGNVSGNRTSSSLMSSDPALDKLTSTAYGGGMYISGDATVTGTTFSTNLIEAQSIQTSSLATTACYAYAYGGGLYVAAGTHTLGGLSISGNNIFAKGSYEEGNETAYAYGAGLYISGSVTAEDLSVETNSVLHGKTVYGVGMYSVTTSTLGEQRFTNCTFTGNNFEPSTSPTTGASTASGGGAYINAKYATSIVDVEGCTFSYNTLAAGKPAVGTGKDYGAGMTYAANAAATVNIYSSVFHHNSFRLNDATRTGVGLYGSAAVLNLYNSLFYQNTNGNYSVYAGVNKIMHNTIAEGGGLYIYGGSASSVVANNIVWNTGSYGINGNTVDGLQVKNNAVSKAIPTTKDWVLENNIETLNENNAVAGGPYFADFDVLDMSTFLHLTESSAVLVDAGYDITSEPAVSIDYDGVARPQGDHNDIGAYEYYDPLTKDTLKVIAKDHHGTNLIEDDGVDVISESEGDTVWVLPVPRVSPPKVLTVTAVPAPGYRFVEWEEDGVTTAVRDVNMTSNITLTAVFEEIFDEISICSSEQPYTVEITRAGDPSTVLTSFSVNESGATVNSGIPLKISESKKDPQTYLPAFTETYSTTVKAIDGTTDSLVTVKITVNPVYEIDCGEVTINGKSYSPNGVYWTSSKTWIFDDFDTYDIIETFETEGGCDSTYMLTINVVKTSDINKAEAPLPIDWAPSSVTLLMTPVTALSDWNSLGVKVNGGTTMKTIANGGFTYNGDNTITLAHTSASGSEQLLVEIYDLDVPADPIVRLYYDVPYLVASSSTITWNNADQDLWVASGTATIGAGGLRARHITVAPGATLSVAKDAVAKTLTIKSYQNTTGQVKVSSGYMLTLEDRTLVYAKQLKDKSNYYLMSLPYDVDFGDIKLHNGSAPKSSQIALFTYDGEERAHTFQNDAQAISAGETGVDKFYGEYRTVDNLSQRTWKRVTSGTIPANTAFELGTNSAVYREFQFPVTIDRVSYNVTSDITLSYYDYDQQTWDVHYGWNFVGLPSLSEKAAGKAISHSDVLDYPISVYNTSTKKWDQGLSSSVKVLPFSGFFIQAKEAGTATVGAAAAVPTVLSAPAREREDEHYEVFVQLALTKGEDAVAEAEPSEEEPIVEEEPAAVRRRVVVDEAEGEEEPEESDALLTESEESAADSDDANMLADVTSLRISSSMTAAYDLGYDMEKLLTNTEGATAPIFYSFSEVGRMALSAMPLASASQPIALGARYATAGSHIISLKGLPQGDAVEAVLLHDAVTGSVTDLLERAYHFTVSGAKTEDSRFSIELRMPEHTDIATGVEETLTTANTGVTVSSSNGVVTLSGFEGKARVRLYDVTGRLLGAESVMSGDALQVPSAGVYVLSIDANKMHDAVKIIYNK